MTKLTMRFKNKRAMGHGRLDQFMVFGEHLGLMMGGSWSTEKLEAEFWPYPHPADCCDAVPSPKRITPQIKAKLSAWLDEREIAHKWSRG